MNKLKELWYGVLPFLLLLGIPIGICIVIFLINILPDMPKIYERISELGNGSFIYGIILLLFAMIGLINAVIACIMWLKRITEILERKACSAFWFWFAIFVVTIGWYAFSKLLWHIGFVNT